MIKELELTNLTDYIVKGKRQMVGPNQTHKTIKEDIQQRLKIWLQGSTCHRQPKSVWWVSDDERFAVFKHHGHSEYVDRCSGTMRCPTHYALYDMTNPPSDAMGSPCIWKTEGRWLKSHWTELEIQIVEYLRTQS